MNRMREFERSYIEAYKHINRVLEKHEGAYDYDLKLLTEWLLTTDIKIDSLFEAGLKNLTNTIEGMSCLISHLYHAMYEDGDVTFGTVYDDPFILFGEDVRVDKKMGVKEFIEYAEERHKRDIVKWYIIDASRNGVDHADRYYHSYRHWSESWKDDYADKINEEKQRLKNLGILE